MAERPKDRLVTIDGETRTLYAWAKVYGIKYQTVYERLSRGWSPQEAVTLPEGQRRDICAAEPDAPEDRCRGCSYSRQAPPTFGSVSMCAYLEITGHRRPYKAAECPLNNNRHIMPHRRKKR